MYCLFYFIIPSDDKGRKKWAVHYVKFCDSSVTDIITKILDTDRQDVSLVSN